MNKLRVVLDTNILISGLLLSPSIPQQIFDRVTDTGTLLISEETFEEISQTITRQKFDKYLSLENRLLFISSLRNKAKIVKVTETINICRDPKDNKFLELAISGKATHIITGDKDLLELNPFRGIAILTPKQLLKLID